MCNLQNMQRVIEERLPLLASCADELAIMQCAALSCVAALLAAQAGMLTSANRSSRKGTQEAGELPLTSACVCTGKDICSERVFPTVAFTPMLCRWAHQPQSTSGKW